MASVNVDILKSPLEAKVDDREFHCRASRRCTTYTQPRAASRFQKHWKFGVPNCWTGLVIRKYGEKTFKVRFMDVFIAAARAPHMAPKQAYGGATQAHRQVCVPKPYSSC